MLGSSLYDFRVFFVEDSAGVVFVFGIVRVFFVVVSDRGLEVFALFVDFVRVVLSFFGFGFIYYSIYDFYSSFGI